MLTPVRAKFRCLGLTRRYDDCWTAELAPVYNSNGKHPENDAWWKATPSGKADLNGRGGTPFEPGAFYYIDFIPTARRQMDNPGDAVISVVSDRGDTKTVEVHLRWTNDPGVIRGSISMHITNPSAWELFVGHVGEVLTVEFDFASPNDGSA